VRCRRGRLEAAERDLAAARAALAERSDCGVLRELSARAVLELSAARHGAEAAELVEPPSEAETIILRMLAGDLSVPQIASELFLSVNTVRSHTRSLYRKLGVNSRSTAVARAEVLGLLPASNPSNTVVESIGLPG
jgi:LuxR family maltose regulon positive regulatory protein